MPRSFTRILTFKVEGEIYDTETKPEDIIRNYDWKALTSNYNDAVHIMADHDDHRGRITLIEKLPGISKSPKHPDSEYFMI